jgi:uncharacterized protein YjlB
VGSSIDFAVVGAYAGSRHYDMLRGDPAEGARKSAEVPLPRCDPVYGPEGPLLRAWGPGR